MPNCEPKSNLDCLSLRPGATPTDATTPARYSRKSSSTLARHNRAFGFTLVELCVSLLILSILMRAAYPSLQSFIAQTQATTLANDLVSLLHYARLQALHHQRSVTLCSLVDNECQRPWQTSLTVFVDQAPLGSLENADQALLTIALPDDAKILWRSFRRKGYLRFTGLGATDNQNGTLITCPRPGEIKAARKIVINRQGRFRVAKSEPDALAARLEQKGC
jgi:type IV fimbrial biogenesis protein FimT